MADFENLVPEDMQERPLGEELDEALEATPAEEMAEMLRARSATYLLLSRLFHKEVDQVLLDDMHDSLYPVATGDADIDKGYLYISTYLSNLWSESLRQLKVDYARCFLGQGVDGYSAAYPYESVYTSEKRLMMQDARDEVLAIYRSQGLDKQETWKEAEDHLALELEFMQILANRTVDALKAGDEDAAIDLLATQKNFLEDHLMAWVPMMTSDMRRFAKTDLYRGLASLTDGFMTVDFEFLQDLLQA